MAYLKRNNFGKFWPIPRKGTTYVTVSSHNKTESIPLMVVMRDVLKFVKNKKELMKIIHEKQITINGKEVREANYPICLFDILSLKPMKKNYQAVLTKNKKYAFEEVAEKDAKSRVYKIINKKIISKDKIQLNLMQGKNIISKEKMNIGDSVVLDFENKVVKVLELKSGGNAVVIEGKHSGNKGKIEEIIERGGKKLVKIASEGEKINVWIKNVIVIE